MMQVRNAVQTSPENRSVSQKKRFRRRPVPWIRSDLLTTSHNDEHRFVRSVVSKGWARRAV
jgi:hypothetical protein